MSSMQQHMNRNSGLHFSKLFTVQELGFKNPEPFVGPLIRQFLKIGEAVAGRWIEMPQGILIFQMVAGVPDSGAIYLYDRRDQVFYIACFDGNDDHLTLEEFNRLLVEYDLLQYAEQPGLVRSLHDDDHQPLVFDCVQPGAVADGSSYETREESGLTFVPPGLLPPTGRTCRSPMSRAGSRWYPFQSLPFSRLQSTGSA